MTNHKINNDDDATLYHQQVITMAKLQLLLVNQMNLTIKTTKIMMMTMMNLMIPSMMNWNRSNQIIIINRHHRRAVLK
jgi:hypothetical protein